MLTLDLTNEELVTLGAVCRKIVDGEISLFEGVHQNFNFAIANFSKTKEVVLEKREKNDKSFELYFDLDKHNSFVVDLLFLGSVILKSIKEQSEDIKSAIMNDIYNKSLSVRLFATHYDKNTLNDKEIEMFNRLICSLVLFQKVRDSFAHNSNGTFSYDDNSKVLHIHNLHRSSPLRCDIPVSYIMEFGKGIKPLKEDLELVNQANDDTKNIFLKLGYKLKNIPRYFYRIPVERLSRLLKVVNNDVSKIPEILFLLSNDEFQFYLENCFDGDYSKIIEIKPIYYSRYVRNRELIMYVHNVLLKGDYRNGVYIPNIEGSVNEFYPRMNHLLNIVHGNVKEFEKLPVIFFDWNKTTIEQIDNVLQVVNGDYTKLKDFPDYCYSVPTYGASSEQTSKMLIGRLKYLDENGVYRYNYTMMGFLYELVGRNAKEFNTLPSGIMCIRSFNQIITLLKYVNYDYTRLRFLDKKFLGNSDMFEYLYNKLDGDLDKMSKVPDFIFSFSIYAIDKFLNAFDLNLESISYKYKKIFTNPGGVEIKKALYLLLNKDIDLYNKIDVRFVRVGYLQSVSNLKVLVDLFTLPNGEIDITSINEINFNVTVCDPDRVKFIISIVGREYLKYVPLLLFTHPSESYVVDFLNLFKDNYERLQYVRDYYMLPDSNHSLDILKKLLSLIKKDDYQKYSKIFSYVDSTRADHESLIKILNVINNDLDVLANLPSCIIYGSYSCNLFIELCEILKYDMNKIVELPEYIFDPFVFVGMMEINVESVKYILTIPEIFDGSFKLKDLPRELFTISIERINALLNLPNINGDFSKIDTIPRELFYCDETVFADLTKVYEENMVKYIFGLENPKLIALMTYMNSLFSLFYANDEYVAGVKMKSFEITKNHPAIESRINSTINHINRYVSKINSLENKKIENDVLLTANRIFMLLGDIKQIKKSTNESLLAQNHEFVRVLRNVAEHLRIEEISNDIIRVQDYTVDINGGKNIKFEAKVSINDMFDLLDSILSHKILDDEEIASEIDYRVLLKDHNNQIISDVDKKYHLVRSLSYLKIFIQRRLNKIGIMNISSKFVENVCYIEYVDLNGNIVTKEIGQLYNELLNDDFDHGLNVSVGKINKT